MTNDAAFTQVSRPYLHEKQQDMWWYQLKITCCTSCPRKKSMQLVSFIIILANIIIL